MGRFWISSWKALDTVTKLENGSERVSFGMGQLITLGVQNMKNKLLELSVSKVNTKSIHNFNNFNIETKLYALIYTLYKVGFLEIKINLVIKVWLFVVSYCCFILLIVGKQVHLLCTQA